MGTAMALAQVELEGGRALEALGAEGAGEGAHLSALLKTPPGNKME